MSKSMQLKAALAVAGLLAFSTAQAADNNATSRTDYSAHKERIEAMYKADKAACDKLSGNAKDICVEEAKGKQKIALAELDHTRSGKDANKVAEARAEANYAVAKERCDDMAGNAKDVCMKDAKAVETQARTSAKANHEAAEARTEARHEQRDANYDAARERCDSLAGDAKDSCVNAAKSQFGKK